VSPPLKCTQREIELQVVEDSENLVTKSQLFDYQFKLLPQSAYSGLAIHALI
jgi:hypothetical protein